MTTMLHVTDSHVVRFIPYAEYRQSLVGEKQQRPDFLGLDPSTRGRNVHGMLVVGAQSTDPQRYKGGDYFAAKASPRPWSPKEEGD